MNRIGFDLQGTTDTPSRLDPQSFITRTKNILGANYHLVFPVPYTPDVLRATRDPLMARQGLLAYGDMMRDDMVELGLSLLISVLVPQVRVVPADDTADAKLVADEVDHQLKNLPGGATKKIARILLAFMFGFSVTEMCFGLRTDAEGFGDFILKDLKWRSPYFFDFRENPSTGELDGLRQVDIMGGTDSEVDLRKVIHFVVNEHVDPFRGQSIFRPAYDYWWEKQAFKKLRAIQAERLAGKLELQHTDETKLSSADFNAIADVVLKAYQYGDGYKLPPGMVAKVVSGEASPQYWTDLMNDCDQRLLGPTHIPWLMVRQPSGAGTYSLADVQKEVMGSGHAVCRSDLEEKLSEPYSPLWWIVKGNGWAMRHQPRLALSPAAEADRIKRIEIYNQSVIAGTLTPLPQHQNWILAGLGLPEVDEAKLKAAAAQRALLAPAAGTQGVEPHGASVKPPAPRVSIDQAQFAADLVADPSVWSMVPVPPSTAAAIALPGGEQPEDLHVTLAYSGRRSELKSKSIDWLGIDQGLAEVARSQAPLTARAQGLGRFSASQTSDGLDVVYASVDAPGLVALRQSIAHVLLAAGCPPKTEHDFTPHITLAYIAPSAPMPLHRVDGGTFTIDRFVFEAYGQRAEYRLQGSAVRCFAQQPASWQDRPLTRMEKRVKFGEIEKGMSRLIGNAQQSLTAEWTAELARLRAEVKGWVRVGHALPRDLPQRTTQLKLDVTEFVKHLAGGAVDAYRIGSKQAAIELHAAGAGALRFDAAAPVDPYALGNFEGLLQSRSFWVADQMRGKALKQIADALMNMYADGDLTTQDQIDQLDATFDGLASGHLISPGTPGHDYTEPAVQETTIRTLYNDSMNGGRQELFQQNRDFVRGFVISEVAEGQDVGKDGKLRSHPLSEHLDGLIVPLDSPYAKQLAGSQHYNDRKVDVPWTVLDEGIEASTPAELEEALAWKRELSPNFA